ncbi:hypothetical protein [Adhaeribacter soli]|uniref:DUF5723 domain-containing protein n=1 Tax=Adhaeribacter soli TaxID=2607655 RepID=A0A5N1IM37_9BACT|nr:hypothetical protein [Adhaeribacter soli]KAA9327418.1 hypothetical protein F0P94_16010 [Adhaeribacter soli]
MKLFAAILLLFWSLLAQAQMQAFKLKPHQKQWEQGALTWNDFQGILPSNAIGSELNYQLVYSPGKVRFADSTFFIYQVYGFVDVNRSWVNDAVKTEGELKFNQAKFNLLEIHRRELQAELKSPIRSRDAHWAAGRTLMNLKNAMDQFQTAAENGRNATLVNAFLDSTGQVLQVTGKTTQPEFRTAGFGCGTHLGFGYRGLGGTLGRHFTNPLGWEYNLALAYQRSLLNLDLSLGFNQIDRQYLKRPQWEVGMQTSMLQAGVSYGFIAADKNKVRFTPFVGVAALGIQPRNQYLNGINNTSAFYAGLNIDFKFRKRIWLLPSAFNPKEIADYGLRARISVMPAKYDHTLKGTSICLTLAPYIFSRIVKSKKLY